MRLKIRIPTVPAIRDAQIDANMKGRVIDDMFPTMMCLTEE
jgi:hypothetical protein